jgi:hypothetical protein
MPFRSSGGAPALAAFALLAAAVPAFAQPSPIDQDLCPGSFVPGALAVARRPIGWVASRSTIRRPRGGPGRACATV